MFNNRWLSKDERGVRSKYPPFPVPLILSSHTPHDSLNISSKTPVACVLSFEFFPKPSSLRGIAKKHDGMDVGGKRVILTAARFGLELLLTLRVGSSLNLWRETS